MNDVYKCPACGIELGSTEAERAGYRCEECGDQLVSDEVKEARKGSSMLTYVLLALIIITLGAMYWQIRGKGEGSPSGSDQRFVDSLLESALELNDKTPLMLDKSTRLERIEIEDKKIIYVNTLINLTAESSKDKNLFKKGIKPFLADKYCQDKTISRALNLGVRYGHMYYGVDGALLFTADVSAEDCPADKYNLSK